MKAINPTRVLLAGLAAGVLVNVTEFVLWGVLLRQDYEAMIAGHGLVEAGWALPAYVLGTFVYTIVLAFLYAAFRSVFDTRWASVAAAAGVLWVLGIALPTTWNGAVGLAMAAGATILSLLWAAVEAAMAGVLAAWVYQRRAAPAPATARTP